MPNHCLMFVTSPLASKFIRKSRQTFGGVLCVHRRKVEIVLTCGLYVTMGVSRGVQGGANAPPLEFENDDAICCSPVKYIP